MVQMEPMEPILRALVAAGSEINSGQEGGLVPSRLAGLPGV